MALFYRFIYSILVLAITPLLLIRLFYKHPDYRKRWWERFGILSRINSRQPVIWIHAVSVGEVKLTEQLVHEINKQYPKRYSFLITTTTPSGEQQVRRQFSAEVLHRFFPYDVPLFLKRFIQQVQPTLLLVIETELWPNLFAILNKKNIPVILVNGRMSERSYLKYAQSGINKLGLFENVNWVYAQTDDDANRFRQLGIHTERVFSVGNLKFDAVERAAKHKKMIRDLVKMVSQRPVWIAASTHSGEDKSVIDAHKQLLKIMPSALLILAPRHPQRCTQIKMLLDTACISYVTRSSLQCLGSDIAVLLLDTLGELADCYEIARLSFIGGSLVEHGGQNPLEAIQKNVPVIVGPHTHNFYTIYKQLIERDAAIQVLSTDDFKNVVLELMNNPLKRDEMSCNARCYLLENKGAVKKVVHLISAVLSNEGG